KPSLVAATPATKTAVDSDTGFAREGKELAPVNLPQGPLNAPLNSAPEETPLRGPASTTGGAPSGLNVNISPTAGSGTSVVPPAPVPRGEHPADLPIGGEQVGASANRLLSGYISVNQALNEALIRSPRAAAIRAQLRIQTAQYAAATVMPDPQVYRDES